MIDNINNNTDTLLNLRINFISPTISPSSQKNDDFVLTKTKKKCTFCLIDVVK